jgi:DNA-binding NarL/FixJ family response regulator
MSTKILIVDDHEIVRHGLRSVLRGSSEIEIVGEAIDGMAGIAMAAEFLPDVVLMDIRMPRMDGIAATKEIKEKLQNTRVLILTSNDNQEDMFAALAAGADGYCLKDAENKELLLAIQTVHTGATWLDPEIAQFVLKAVTSNPVSSGSPTSGKSSPFALSARELEVVQLLVEGLNNAEMAERLIISTETVKTHMRHIMEKLQVNDRTQAAVKAMRGGLV